MQQNDPSTHLTAQRLKEGKRSCAARTLLQKREVNNLHDSARDTPPTTHPPSASIFSPSQAQLTPPSPAPLFPHLTPQKSEFLSSIFQNSRKNDAYSQRCNRPSRRLRKLYRGAELGFNVTVQNKQLSRCAIP